MPSPLVPFCCIDFDIFVGCRNDGVEFRPPHFHVQGVCVLTDLNWVCFSSYKEVHLVESAFSVALEWRSAATILREVAVMISVFALPVAGSVAVLYHVGLVLHYL